MLTVQPITLREARAFVTRVHRHHKAPQGGLFAVAASEGDVVRAVVIVGKPVARCGVAQPVHGITEHLGPARCRSCTKAVEKRRAA